MEFEIILDENNKHEKFKFIFDDLEKEIAITDYDRFIGECRTYGSLLEATDYIEVLILYNCGYYLLPDQKEYTTIEDYTKQELKNKNYVEFRIMNGNKKEDMEKMKEFDEDYELDFSTGWK